ncbi:hypothetical protein CMV_002313 [Castanea mollissima]|uniref:Uncharacterized protein n=1 Tax=Castanea mollissima TaxID=60419 RepID=A0A8J4RWP0_9ROSI|nr:hypothetical protein CMV_002313 [Castanea mollissima]
MFSWGSTPGRFFTKVNGSVNKGQQKNLGGQKEGTGAASVAEGKDKAIDNGGGGDQDEARDGGIASGGGGGVQDEVIDTGVGIGGGGGHGEGKRDKGVEEGRSRVGDVEKAMGGKNSRPMKKVEIFIAVIVQSTAAATAIDFLRISSGTRGLLVATLLTNLVGFVFCTAALWQSHTLPESAKILGNIGCATATLGFILMVAMILPPYLIWVIGVACLALLVVFAISLKSS